MGKKKKGKKRSGGVNIVGKGNVFKGDIVGRDKNVTNGISPDAFADMFSKIYNQIDNRPGDTNVDKDELHELVQKVEVEVTKGEDANPNKVERWLRFLASMADDIFQVTVASLTNPVAGISKAVQLIAKKVQAEF
jgi:hypothetical protein